jgi:cytochrome c553
LALTAVAVGFSLVGSAAQAQPGGPLLAACAACHGADGRSELKDIPSLAGQPKIFLENQLVLIREGMREIPAMKAVMAGVSDAQITELAQHYASQSLPAPPGPARPELFERGKAVADASRCGICHLPDYRGREQMPRLAAQREDYLLYSMRQFVSNQAVGRDTIMAASLHGVADADLQALAHYLAHLKP